MNIALVSVFMAATMASFSVGTRHSVPGPRPVVFALTDAQNYCLRKMQSSFQIVTRNHPGQSVAEVNRPFTDEPQDGVVFQTYESRYETDARGTRQVLILVSLADCPAVP